MTPSCGRRGSLVFSVDITRHRSPAGQLCCDVNSASSLAPAGSPPLRQNYEPHSYYFVTNLTKGVAPGYLGLFYFKAIYSVFINCLSPRWLPSSPLSPWDGINWTD